jgi:hypothetical protein
MANFHERLSFIQLMREKRGTEFTIGWLTMAWSLPLMSDEDEQDLMRQEIEKMMEMSDFDEQENHISQMSG